MFTSFLYPLLLISALACTSTALSYPATVEFDLVFPRNETFAPAPVMPIVWAIQNPVATVALPYEIEWTMRRYGESAWFGNTFMPSWSNYSTDPDPLYVYIWTTFLNSSEGVFTFDWILRSGNCSSQSNSPNATGRLGGTSSNNDVVFTLKKGAPQQSLINPNSKGPDGCPLVGETYNITTTLPVANILDFDFYTTCAVLDPEEPAANPCAAQVNDTVASSISSRITASACSTPIVPFGTAPPALTSGCPAPSSSSSGGSSVAVRSSLGGIAASSVATVSLLTLAVLTSDRESQHGKAVEGRAIARDGELIYREDNGVLSDSDIDPSSSDNDGSSTKDKQEHSSTGKHSTWLSPDEQRFVGIPKFPK